MSVSKRKDNSEIIINTEAAKREREKYLEQMQLVAKQKELKNQEWEKALQKEREMK